MIITILNQMYNLIALKWYKRLLKERDIYFNITLCQHRVTPLGNSIWIPTCIFCGRLRELKGLVWILSRLAYLTLVNKTLTPSVLIMWYTIPETSLYRGVWILNSVASFYSPNSANILYVALKIQSWQMVEMVFTWRYSLVTKCRHVKGQGRPLVCALVSTALLHVF